MTVTELAQSVVSEQSLVREQPPKNDHVYPALDMFEAVAKHVADCPDLPVDTSWRTGASCCDTDPELFFPVGTTGNAVLQIEEAKAVCLGCHSQTRCLEYALLTNQDSGIWGATSEEDRRHLRRTFIGRRRSCLL